ncbi:MAG: lipid-A-disaccharide synthase [Vicinamibacterales bacterium]
MATGPRVLVSCGEASGDLYAGALVEALRRVEPGVDVVAFGGDRLRAAGASLVGDYRGVSVTGLSEAIAALPRSWQLLRRIEAVARERRPDVFVAIDFPDFNFRLLPVMHRLGIPVVYYVSPQLWAWRAGRLETIRRYVRRMLVIFPFETGLYERAGVPVTFVGHPLVDLARATRSREDVLRSAGLDPARPVVALLPGSRPNELRRILPTLRAAVPLIAARVPGAQFLVARAPALDDSLFTPLADLTASGVPCAVMAGEADNVLGAVDVAVTASGTATVQTALHDRPMVMVYRLSPMTYALGRRFVRVPHYAMVNLIAGRAVIRELVQDDLTPEAVAGEAVSLLTDRGRAEAMRRDLAEVRARLGGPGASDRAAAEVLRAAGLWKTDPSP